ncbi:MAG: LLM class F420-dependent oxidoreductase [Acidimicrobiia bacterium]
MASSTRAVRIAAHLHPQHGKYRDLRAAVENIEDMGFDLLYTWDHFFPLYGERDGTHFECWSMLAAWAEQTARVEIGALVTCNSYRNPDLLADVARTVDHISGGRLVFGIGSGWFQRDYDEYGYEFGTKGRRLDRLAETLPRIKARWGKLNPPPIRPLPVLIAGGGLKKTLRIVAEHADSWHGGFPDDPAEMELKVEALRRWCAELGRNPTEIEWGLGVEPDDLDRFLSKDAPTYVEMGFTQFTLGCTGPAWDVERGREWLSWRDSLA